MHWPLRLTLASHGTYVDLYRLRVSYAGCADDQYIGNVHVPPALRPALEQSPEGFHLETLAIGSAASRLLPGEPVHAVVAVVDCNGGTHTHVPERWLRIRRRTQLHAGACGAVALLLAVSVAEFGVPAALAACAVACFAHRGWQLARGLTVRPMHILSEIGS